MYLNTSKDDIQNNKTSSNRNKSKENNNHINNSIHYFNKVIKNMNNKEFQELKIIYKTEISMEMNDFDICRQSKLI